MQKDGVCVDRDKEYYSPQLKRSHFNKSSVESIF